MEDFIFFSPVFNFADACVSVGIVVLFLFYRKDLENLSDTMLGRKANEDKEVEQQIVSDEIQEMKGGE